MSKTELTMTQQDEQQLKNFPQMGIEAAQQEKKPRGRKGGRPKGSKNKPKGLPPFPTGDNWAAHAIPVDTAPAPEAPPIEGAPKGIEKPRSSTLYRRWQRGWIKPQFAISRNEAYEVFLKYLRSTNGKSALREVIVNGSPGIGKLSDAALAKYLEKTNLLSRYPHEVVIK